MYLVLGNFYIRYSFCVCYENIVNEKGPNSIIGAVRVIHYNFVSIALEDIL